jgi:ubiquinone/menaquinone biosynthesis C-methylase UbiE
MPLRDANVDKKTVVGFGREWSAFTQDETGLSAAERAKLFDDYFAIFPWDALPPGGGTGCDVGCGSGRWAMVVAPRVTHLHVLDVSPQALEVAKHNLAGVQNVSFHLASVEDIPVPDGSLDFAYSLGVLHHVPDTARAIGDITRKLKAGAPLLVYIYYALENKPWWYVTLWRASGAVRLVVSHLPHVLRYPISQVIAATVYWPVARLARAFDAAGLMPASWPLAYYRDKSFYVMRTDAYDRFCTRLEQRFTRAQIATMLKAAGYDQIRFSERAPFWCAVGVKKPPG